MLLHSFFIVSLLDSLEVLIGSDSVDWFLKEIFERKMFHFAHELNPRFNFSFRDFESVLSLPGVRPFLRVVNRQVADHDPKILSDNGHLSKPYLLSRFYEGSSIVINEIHHFHAGLMNFSSRLSEQLGVSCVINAYLTPAESVALSPHFDSHDIFAIQIDGRKDWFVDPSDSPLTTKSSFQPILSDSDAESLGLTTVSMDVGDVLYLPRGCVHHARTTSAHSLHLTVGLYPVEWSELVGSILEASSSVPSARQLRQSVPLGTRRVSPKVVRNSILQLLPDLLSDEVIESALRSQEKRLCAVQPASFVDALQRSRCEQSVPLSDLLLTRCSEAVYFYRVDGGLRIVSSGYGFTLRHGDLEFLEMLISGSEPFTLQALRGCDNCSVLDLACVEQLIHRGILLVAESSC